MTNQPNNQPSTSREERQWATFIHLAFFGSVVIPFGNVFGPLILWLVKKEGMPFIDHHGKEAVNFGITTSIALIVTFVVSLQLMFFVGPPFILFHAVLT